MLEHGLVFMSQFFRFLWIVQEELREGWIVACSWKQGRRRMDGHSLNRCKCFLHFTTNLLLCRRNSSALMVKRRVAAGTEGK